MDPGFGVNNILFQRGIYPQETFKSIHEFGIPILVTTNKELEKYLSNLLADVEGFNFLSFQNPNHQLMKQILEFL